MLGRLPNAGREEQLIAFALVRTFEMIMLDKLINCPTERVFAERDELG
jgi:hypothetical protein